MRFLPLIWSGIWRKPGRTLFPYTTLFRSFALFGVLQGLKSGVEHLVAAARADLLIVHTRANFIFSPLPLGLLEPIRSVPGVKMVVPVELSGGTSQKPDQQVGIVAVSPEGDWLSAFTFTVAPEYDAALRNTRTGALVPEELAKKYGWKIGDHIPLMTRTTQLNGSTTWEFDVVGRFDDSDIGGGRDKILSNFFLYNGARQVRKE